MAAEQVELVQPHDHPHLGLGESPDGTYNFGQAIAQTLRIVTEADPSAVGQDNGKQSSDLSDEPSLPQAS